jgi:hypothetical protein
LQDEDDYAPLSAENPYLSLVSIYTVSLLINCALSKTASYKELNASTKLATFNGDSVNFAIHNEHRL